MKKSILVTFVFLFCIPICSANASFEVYELGHANFYWNMPKIEVLETIHQFQNKLEKSGGRSTLDTSNSSLPVLICEGSLERPHNRLYKNKYIFQFEKDKLVKVELTIDMGPKKAGGAFRYYVGTKKEAMDMEFDDIKDLFTLKYGSPEISQTTKAGWSTDNNIIILNNYSIAHQIKIKYLLK